MTRFAADLFDGLTSQAHPVSAWLDGAHLRVEGEGVALAVPLADVTLAPPVGAARGVVHLSGGRELHSADLAALSALADALPTADPERWARRLESRWSYALAALVVSVFVMFAGLRWGVPATAYLAAKTLPAGLDARIGRESLAAMDRLAMAESRLPSARRQALQAELDARCRRQPCPAYRLLFRESRLFGANAMALPGGTIIVTDDLVKLAQHDEEVLAVIAHELGHVQHRHSLRLALQSIGAGVVLVAITGDVSSVTDLAAGLPSLLLQTGYSRDMEREADRYALAWLQTACIAPRRFADILGRLDKHPDDTGLLDSHPGSRERVRPFASAAGC